MSNVWNIFQEKTFKKKTLTTRSTTFFWFPVKDIKISDIFYKTQKFLRISLTPKISTNRINCLIAGPLDIEIVIAYQRVLDNWNQQAKPINLVPRTLVNILNQITYISIQTFILIKHLFQFRVQKK